jgi:hypothetical protein
VPKGLAAVCTICSRSARRHHCGKITADASSKLAWAPPSAQPSEAHVISTTMQPSRKPCFSRSRSENRCGAWWSVPITIASDISSHQARTMVLQIFFTRGLQRSSKKPYANRALAYIRILCSEVRRSTRHLRSSSRSRLRCGCQSFGSWIRDM